MRLIKLHQHHAHVEEINFLSLIFLENQPQGFEGLSKDCAVAYIGFKSISARQKND